MATPALELRGVSVHFGAVRALSSVDFAVYPGEVVALVGDNGAGKSTLVKAMSGIRTPDEGEILLDGQPAHIASPKDASALGIATVFQDLALCDDLDIVGNLFLGREQRTGALGNIDEDGMELEARDLLASLNVTTVTSLRARVSRLSGGQRQSIAVARSLIGKPKIVILDEPTAALGVAQTAEVLALVRRLRDQGIGVVLISHNMGDVMDVSDRIHVLRLGRVNGIFRSSEVTSEQVVSAITGATLHETERGGSAA